MFSGVDARNTSPVIPSAGCITRSTERHSRHDGRLRPCADSSRSRPNRHRRLRVVTTARSRRLRAARLVAEAAPGHLDRQPDPYPPGAHPLPPTLRLGEPLAGAQIPQMIDAHAGAVGRPDFSPTGHRCGKSFEGLPRRGCSIGGTGYPRAGADHARGAELPVVAGSRPAIVAADRGDWCKWQR